jgi:hypothetical protein
MQRSSSETESLHTSSSTHLLMESTGYAEDMQVGGAMPAGQEVKQEDMPFYRQLGLVGTR